MKVVILGHAKPDVDSVLSGILLEKKLNETKTHDVNYQFVIPDNDIDPDTIDIVKELGLDISKYKNIPVNPEDHLILVDHNDENRYNNPVEAVIDHHPQIHSQLENNSNIIYINQASCSTTTIIAKKFPNNITKDDFVLVLTGALVDTASFNSTKTNKEEAEWLKARCQEYNIDYEKYYNLGLCLSDISDLDKAFLNGKKSYKYEDYNIQSSYIQIRDVEGNQDKIQEMLNRISMFLDNSDYDIFVFIVHDMDRFKTTTYTVTKDKTEIKQYDKYESRGNTIIPNLFKSLEDKPKTM